MARQLGIPLHVRNVQKEYFERVVEHLKAGYAAGETPNPDVLCNSEIKFGILYDWAMEQGYDFLATGHYARTESGNNQFPITNSQRMPNGTMVNDQSNSHPSLGTGNWTLATAEDRLKDQTYFLWRVPRERFEHILFPIGHLEKSEVRRLAAHYSLLTAKKPDSQGICFLGSVNVHDWLKRELRTKPGPVMTRDGQRVGTHEGAELATIGQRQGLGITGGGPVYYVVEKQVSTNTLIVDTKPAAMRDCFDVISPNWLVDRPFDYPNIEARIRHQGERIPVSYVVDRRSYAGKAQGRDFDLRSTIYDLRLASPAFAVAPGQSVVFYSDTIVLGGGIIK